MPYTNYRAMQEAIENREPFEGNSASAFIDESSNYIIMSYDTIMAVISESGEVVSFNEKRYSTTTSRLQNMIRRAYNIK